MKAQLNLLLASALCISSALPVFADETDGVAADPAPVSDGTQIAAGDDGAKEAKDDDKKDAKADTGKASTKSSSAGDGGIMNRAASFTAGVVVGTPIAIVRKCKTEIVQATKDLTGDTDKLYFILPAGLLGMPFGALSGTVEGTFLGIINSWKASGDEPFSKEAFSLGDM